MNCKKCGAVLTPEDQFCKNCGETVNSQTNNVGTQQPVETPNNNFGQPAGMGQPVNNAQPSYNNMNNNGHGWQNYNNAPMYNNQPMNKPSGNGKYIAIGLAIIVGIFAIIFIVGMVTSKDDNNSLTSGGSNNTNVTQTSKTNYKVNFKGFTFEIPDNLVYEEDDGTLLIGDEAGTWATILELEQGSFTQLQANKGQLQSMMQQSGYIASAATEKTLGGVNFITLEITKSGQKAIAALAKANSMYFIGVTALNQDNDYDYKLLETIAPIIKSAQYTGSTTNNISGTNKIDMSGISELAK